MPDTDIERLEPTNLIGSEAIEPGSLSIEEKPEDTTSPVDAFVASTVARPLPPIPARALERVGTIEHLAARRPAPEIQDTDPAVKQQLTELRSEFTRLVTGLRWGGESVEDTAARIIPLLNIGPVQQWKQVLMPFLREIDRVGNLIPAWLNIIEQEEPSDLSPDTNPAETPLGRARRYAILMLGNYKTLISNESISEAEEEPERPVELRLEIQFANATKSVDISNQDKSSKQNENGNSHKSDQPDLPKVLGPLAIDPNTSIYATQALVQLSTTAAIQTLVTSLRDAAGWAKVDIVEGCLALNQPRFYDLLVASGLDHAPGLESYLAIPIYRTIPLENYLRGGSTIAPRLVEQSTLIFSQVLLESANPPKDAASDLPPVFVRDLPTLSRQLFEQARRDPNWHNAIALHRLGVLLGNYWSQIAKRQISDERIVDPITNTLPIMHDVERWMAGPGRDVLLNVLTSNEEDIPIQAIRVLDELRDPRATLAVMTRIEATTELRSRSHASVVAALCDMLGNLGDKRAIQHMQLLLSRVADVNGRGNRPKRRDNLPSGDAEIPASVVYGAIIRAFGKIGDPSVLEQVLLATRDFDPFVRTQALEALQHVDASSSDMRSRQAEREALNDPRDMVVRAACQLAVHYHDVDAYPAIQRIIDTRPELAPVAYDTLRKLGQ